jgi:hypothetical protein
MNRFQVHAARESRRGTTLVMILLCVFGLASLAMVALTIGLSHAKEQRGERQEIHAGYVCQAGLSQAMYQMQRGLGGSVGTRTNPTIWGASRFYVEATNVTPMITRLCATGIEDKNGASQELVVQAVPNTIWRYGLFGRETLHMDSNARVDSYNSTLGSYASQATNGSGSNTYALTNGDIGSNGDIVLDANAKVWGDAIPGPSHTATLNGNSVVTGNTLPSPALLDMPVINAPTYTSFGNLVVNSATTIPAGNRSYGTITVRQNKTLTLTGPGNIVISNLVTNSNANIIIDATNGPVTLYVLDNFILDSNSTIHSTDNKPSNVRLNLLSDNVVNPEVTVQLDVVDFNSNSSIYGTVLAPNAHILLDSNFALYGSLMARSLDVDSNSTFHFDEDLMNSTANGNPTFETLSWREIPYQH